MPRELSSREQFINYVSICIVVHSFHLKFPWPTLLFLKNYFSSFSRTWPWGLFWEPNDSVNTSSFSIITYLAWALLSFTYLFIKIYFTIVESILKYSGGISMYLVYHNPVLVKEKYTYTYVCVCVCVCIIYQITMLAWYQMSRSIIV